MARPHPSRHDHPRPVARSGKRGEIALRVALVVAILMPPARFLLAWLEERVVSFPFDDPWIHLTYARTLLETGRWSYTPGAPVTTGSSSPLWVLLEAALMPVIPNEKLLAILLGCLAHAVFVLVLGRWFLRRTGSPAWSALALLLLVANSQVTLLALSGMETSLFLLAESLAFWRWSEDDALGAALAVGLATWVRPEGLLLGAVLAIDAVLQRRVPRRATAAAVSLLALLGGYLAFNRSLGGHWLPGTVSAKAALAGQRSLVKFVRNDLMWVFGHAELLLAPLAVVAVWRGFAAGVVREARVTAEAGFSLALVLAIALGVHHAHVFGRYLVPALPAWILCGVQGLRLLERGDGLRRPPRRWLVVALAAAAVAWQISGFAQHAGEYAHYVRYYHDRHERAGRWLAEHTPPTAVIATHDVGAIAYYSRRRIVDLMGLVTPEVVPHLGRPGFERYLDTLLPARGVTHVAVLENLAPIDNQRPVFEAVAAPEFLHIYEYRPGVTHFIPLAAQALNDSATDQTLAGRAAAAEQGLRRSLAIDDHASTTWTLLASVLLARGDSAGAEAAFRSALARFPEQADARGGLAETLRRAGRLDEARAESDSLAKFSAAASAAAR